MSDVQTDMDHEMGKLPAHSRDLMEMRPAIISAIVPRTVEEVFRLSQMIFQGGLAPNDLKNASAVATVILQGLELELPPMAALSGIAVINGRPTIWGDLMMAIVRRSGLLDKKQERFEGEELTDAWTAICVAKRRGQEYQPEEELEVKFSWLMAKRAKLAPGLKMPDNKICPGKKGPWEEYPDVMMGNKARNRCLHGLFQDVLKGVGSREEALDALQYQADEPSRILHSVPSAPPPPTIDHRQDEGGVSRETPEDPEADWAETEAEDLQTIETMTRQEALVYIANDVDQHSPGMPKAVRARLMAAAEARPEAMRDWHDAEDEILREIASLPRARALARMAAAEQEFPDLPEEVHARWMAAARARPEPEAPEAPRELEKPASERDRPSDDDVPSAPAEDRLPDQDEPKAPATRDEYFEAERALIRGFKTVADLESYKTNTFQAFLSAHQASADEADTMRQIVDQRLKLMRKKESGK